MPYCKQKNLLYIHIPKNGGKTVEILLNMHQSYNGSPNSRSFLNTVFKYLLNKTTNHQASEQLLGVIDHSFAAQHLTLQEIEICNFMSIDNIKKAKILTTVRNPYNRAYSLFNHWINEKKNELNVEKMFHDFLLKVGEKRKERKHSVYSHFRQQVDYLKNSQGIIENIRILHLETLKCDLIKFCKEQELNIDVEEKLSLTKFESNENLRTISMSKRNKELVYELFKDDFRLLDYTV